MDQRFAEVMNGGYRALLRLREAGAIGAIGVGVNEWQACQRFAEAGDFDCFLLAGRYTLLEQAALDSFLPLCVARNIAIIIGGPFNTGILATGAVPGATYNYHPASPVVMERVSRIEAICRGHGVALASAALQFPLHHPAVASVIPGARSAAEVAANLATFEAPVPAALWAELKESGLLRADAPTP
jgi:D-threo-aldose 1-dehydrogenase